jgi:competence ComEA-like helix-hairpin-helix protein
MPAGWPPATQRVLLSGAAALLAFTLFAAQRPARTPRESPVPDDPALEVRIDVNTAPAAELEALPGIGAALAARIVAERTARGAFRSVEDLVRVPGVGEKLAERLRPLVTCGGSADQ